MGSRLQGGRGGSNHSIRHRYSPLYHFDGLHWEFHWLLFILHLAGDFPLEIATAFHELDGYGLRHLYHLFRPDLWGPGHVLLWQGP